MSDEIELELIAMANGGNALGRHDGLTVFVPFAIPGERIAARIVETRGRVAHAEGVRLLDASADRVYPACAHFGQGKCGLCHWQHIAAGAQALLKTDVLADQLGRVGRFDDATVERVLRPIIPAPQEWGYSHSLSFQVTDGGALGFPRQGGGAPLTPDECHIAHPDLMALYHQLDMDTTGITRIRLQQGSDGAQMMVISVADEANVPELHADFPVSVNLLTPDNEPVNLIGQSHLTYTVNGRNLRATAGSYFRQNVGALGALVDTVIALAEPATDHAILDLYGGVGVYSAFLAPLCGLVTLVESYPPAASDADENLSDFDNVDVIEGGVEDVLDSIEDEYQAAILDPSAEGLSLDAVDLLGELALARLVYVGSDPATFARDLERLVRHGYRLEVVQPLDLAPQTYAVTAIARLSR